MQAVGALVHAPAIAADKDRGRHKALTFRQAAAKSARGRIQPGGDAYSQWLSRGAHVEPDSSAELDPQVDAGIPCRVLDRHPGNHLGRLGVGGGSPFETVTFFDSFAMCPGLGRPAGSFFHPPVFQGMSARGGEVQNQAGQEGHLDYLAAAVDQLKMMLDWSGAVLALPDGKQLQFWVIAPE